MSVRQMYCFAKYPKISRALSCLLVNKNVSSEHLGTTSTDANKPVAAPPSLFQFTRDTLHLTPIPRPVHPVTAPRGLSRVGASLHTHPAVDICNIVLLLSCYNDNDTHTYTYIQIDLSLTHLAMWSTARNIAAGDLVIIWQVSSQILVPLFLSCLPYLSF